MLLRVVLPATQPHPGQGVLLRPGRIRQHVHPAGFVRVRVGVFVAGARLLAGPERILVFAHCR